MGTSWSPTTRLVAVTIISSRVKLCATTEELATMAKIAAALCKLSVDLFINNTLVMDLR